jgi:hypothetical protein
MDTLASTEAAKATPAPRDAVALDGGQVGEVLDAPEQVEVEGIPVQPSSKGKRKKHEWTEEEQQEYQAKRAQKRHVRKAKKRDEKKARVEAQPEYSFVDGKVPHPACRIETDVEWLIFGTCGRLSFCHPVRLRVSHERQRAMARSRAH